ncbi:MAG: hypothetical protein ACHQHN_02370 [Sphingobacteriales bacterium]
MKRFSAAILFLSIVSVSSTYAQQVDKIKFFQDTSMINATLTFNMKKVMAQKDKLGYKFPAAFSCKLDSSNINDHILIEVRGHFRRGYCYLPPLKLIYKKNPSAAFYKLKMLKLVSACMPRKSDDQNLLKEYMIYKIYNMITDKSFRVRLLNMEYKDSSGVKKTITEHAFLVEDIGQLAKRNTCDDWTGRKFATERTDRRQMTIVALFEYMIGNTDWSVPVAHNIKLIHSKTDSLALPLVIPYDFDFSGLVNAGYSTPDEQLGTTSVRERVYRGYQRTVGELNDVINIYNQQKANIYAAINDFSLFTVASKKDMIGYLDDFYKTINDPSEMKTAFITNARTP